MFRRDGSAVIGFAAMGSVGFSTMGSVGFVTMGSVHRLGALSHDFATLQCMLVYGRGCGCGSRRRDYVARAQKSIFFLHWRLGIK